MNNQQRNELCHCGSGKKYKNCCMRKDEAQAQLSKQTYDVRRVIGPRTTPY
ncbi:MAG: SEC-C domain-containing protein, partial [Proteobacteria bacterium]|nr:SEC-C domain-containing protein [Pseudomonadota bacterium]